MVDRLRVVGPDWSRAAAKTPIRRQPKEMPSWRLLGVLELCGTGLFLKRDNEYCLENSMVRRDLGWLLDCWVYSRAGSIFSNLSESH